MRRLLRPAVSALSALALLLPPGVQAGEVVDQNPFDPGRKPWKEEKPLPELPELTPKDLQIEAIIAFGAFRGIVAQLDGKLKNALPANAAGKVRIQVGQNFGGGYVLAAIEPNQALVQTGNKRFGVPLVRRVSKGGPPAPAIQPQEPAPVPFPPPAQPAAAAPVETQPVGLAQAIQNAPRTEAAPPQPAQPAEPAANNQPQPGQPTSLLDAIRQAQEASAAKARGAAAGGGGGMPFGAK